MHFLFSSYLHHIRRQKFNPPSWTLHSNYLLCFKVTRFRTGKGVKELRDLDIGTIAEALGREKCAAIIGFHAFTGCDQIGRFNNKTKKSCWDIFIEADQEIVNAFKNLGESETLPTLQTLEALEKFVVKLYASSDSACETLADLRWFLFSRYQLDAEKLPPTFEAFKYKVFRSHFINFVWRRCHLPFQNLPCPENYGWDVDIEGSYDPIMTQNLPAPIAIIEMSSCSCKTGCSTNRCSCRKNGLVCTDLCKCKECQNFESVDDFINVRDENDDW